MASFGVLLLPSANRVYAQQASQLATAELEVFSDAVLGGKLADIDERVVGSVPYVAFEAPELTDRDIAYLSNLSTCYALFGFEDGDLLRPIALDPLDRYDDDLITIQKYRGKTNEQFTKLLLNVAVMSSAFADEMLDRSFSVLDPLCGRGTTLNQALTYGYDAAGIDVDKRDFESYATFIETYLQRKRLKHKVQAAPVRRDSKRVARRLDVTLAPTSDAFKAGETQSLTVINGDTTNARDLIGSRKFDLLVADAPYGVQHGSRSGDKLSRSPLALLEAAVPVWAEMLRSGAGLALSWNTKVAERFDVEAVLEDAGLQVMSEGAYLDFEHRVEEAITRDVIAARKV